MKKTLLLILLFALVLCGCIDEANDGCFDNIQLSFSLQDEYETGDDYDTRIANDVILYVFNNDNMTMKQRIPYEQIAKGGKYLLRKPNTMKGKLDLIAWAVPSNGNVGTIPDWSGNMTLDVAYLELLRVRGGIDSNPAICDLYMGAIAMSCDDPDKSKEHKIPMLHSSCRVEVNVTDILGTFKIPGANPRIELRGTMTKMDMQMLGCGEKAIVHTLLKNTGEETKYSTGRFGVMPSTEGQLLNVRIYNGDDLLASLDVPENSLPTGAKAGGLVKFDYIMGESEFWLTVNGFREQVVVIEGM